jgi:GntR family transcriptional repressor for pyruvate dehydrogenase complex
MTLTYKPLKVPSLKAACITRLEGLILSGELKIGQKLPSERKLAQSLDVSRPVLHEALVDLAAKGLVEIVPRKGVYVNDFRTSGSCALLSTLLAYNEGELDAPFVQSLVDMRTLVETETARLAALKRTAAHLGQFQDILAQETHADRHDTGALAELDFSFHLLVALASGNLMYPLIINSFKGVYVSFTGKFFAKHQGNAVLDEVLAYHGQIVAAISEGDSEAAATVMAEMLQHGAEHLFG